MPLFHVGGSLTQALATLCARRLPGRAVAVGLAQPGRGARTSGGWSNAIRPEALSAACRRCWRRRSACRPTAPTSRACAVPRPAARRFRCRSARPSRTSFKLPVLEVYGMTETSSVHTIAYPDRPIRLGSVGLPLPYSRVRIVKLDADGRCERDCATDEIGVVTMAGPGVFGGYLNDAHNEGAFVERRLGQLRRPRPPRRRRLSLDHRPRQGPVIRGGHNIDPAAIEEMLFQHPAVGARRRGRPARRLCRRAAGRLCAAEARRERRRPASCEAWVRERTPERAAVPVQVISIDPMPLTGVGKVFKPQLRWDAAGRVFTSCCAAARSRHRLQGQGRRAWQPRQHRHRDACGRAGGSSARRSPTRCTRCSRRS